MRSDEIDYLAQLVRAAAGQALDQTKPYLIESRLAPVARHEGFASIRELIGAVRNRRDERVAVAVVEALASTETAFFRDRTPFLRLGSEILPRLVSNRAGRPVRIWIAGCGTGQEAYSVALAVQAARENIGDAAVEILGSDMSSRALERAKAGLYSHFEVQRGLPIRMLIRAFEREEEMWRASPWLRSMVRWSQVNLHRDFSALGGFDVIFCRNVINGMTEAAGRKLIEQLGGALSRDGLLVLGADEAPAAAQGVLQRDDQGIYQVDPAWRTAA